MATRYSPSIFIQPTRKIPPAITDIPHPLQEFETIDQLAGKYYNDMTLSWVIMCANPTYSHEMMVPAGAIVIVPYPLDRVWVYLGTNGQT